jgi:hypothetical protein
MVVEDMVVVDMVLVDMVSSGMVVVDMVSSDMVVVDMVSSDVVVDMVVVDKELEERWLWTDFFLGSTEEKCEEAFSV